MAGIGDNGVHTGRQRCRVLLPPSPTVPVACGANKGAAEDGMQGPATPEGIPGRRTHTVSPKPWIVHAWAAWIGRRQAIDFAERLHSVESMLPEKQKPRPLGRGFRRIKSLAVSYSHMGRPHTTIGAERFHFRVRNGIGWFPLAIAARQTGKEKGVRFILIPYRDSDSTGSVQNKPDPFFRIQNNPEQVSMSRVHLGAAWDMSHTKVL